MVMQMWNTRFVSWFITVQQVVQALTSRGIDITFGYTKWRNLAFALAKEVGVDLSEVFAKLAKSPADTFSDKLDLDDLPLFLHPIWEHHTDPADLDKMLLGTLNAVSGIIPSSVFGMYDKRVVYAPCYCIVFGLCVHRSFLPTVHLLQSIALWRPMADLE